MTNEKYYDDNCPTCKKEMVRRKRDIGKECRKCLMSRIGFAWGAKRRENFIATPMQILQKRSRDKYKNDNERRLKKILLQAKNRSAKSGKECNITIEDLLEVYPKDNKCPVFGIDLYWGNNGSNREHSPSIDRIDSEKGYTKDNIKIISWMANRKKSNFSIFELEAILKYMKT